MLYHDLFVSIVLCQDISVAGKQKGFSKENQENSETSTRSGLLWEVERILKELRDDPNSELPQVLMMENVNQIHSVKSGNMENFQKWIDFLDGMGYSSVWFDMDGQDYGVAQHRERTFMVSMLGNYSFKKPEPIELRKCMRDYLEPHVDAEFYVTNENADKLIEQLIVDGKIPPTGTTNKEIVQLGNCMQTETRDNPNQGRVYDSNGVCPTISTMQGGGRQPMVITEESNDEEKD